MSVLEINKNNNKVLNQLIDSVADNVFNKVKSSGVNKILINKISNSYNSWWTSSVTGKVHSIGYNLTNYSCSNIGIPIDLTEGSETEFRKRTLMAVKQKINKELFKDFKVECRVYCNYWKKYKPYPFNNTYNYIFDLIISIPSSDVKRIGKYIQINKDKGFA